MKPLMLTAIGLSLCFIGLILFFKFQLDQLLYEISNTADFERRRNLKEQLYDTSSNGGIWCAFILVTLFVLSLKTGLDSPNKKIKQYSLVGLVLTLGILAIDILVIIVPQKMLMVDFGYTYLGYGIVSTLCFLFIYSQHNVEMER